MILPLSNQPIHTMKLILILSLMFVSLIFVGCASNGDSKSASSAEAPAEETSDTMGEKTAYEGSTGSGLLMERYKTGQIEGFRE